MKSFSSEKLKEARGSLKVTDVQKLLQVRGLDVTTAAIYLWEKDTAPNSKYLAALADVYGVPIEYFFVDMVQTIV